MKHTAIFLTFVFATPLLAQQNSSPISTQKLTNESREALKSELLKIRDEDQEIRKGKIAFPLPPEVAKEWVTQQARHEARIREIVANHGWPSRKEFGPEASGVVWLVIQHSNLAMIKEFLPAMEQAARNGDLDWGLIATSKDRILVFDGKKQIYGTQFLPGDGLIPQPIEDEANVDKRRSEMGLPPLKEFIEMVRTQLSKGNK